MTVANLPEPPANAHALPCTPATNDLHWTKKRRPQSAAASKSLRRRVRPAVQNAVTTAHHSVAVQPVLPVPLATSQPENALLADRVGRLKLGSGFETLPARVRKGQLLGQVEALSLSWPIQAPADGIVVSVLGAEGAVVEYAQPLFEFEPAANASQQRTAA